MVGMPRKYLFLTRKPISPAACVNNEFPPVRRPTCVLIACIVILALGWRSGGVLLGSQGVAPSATVPPGDPVGRDLGRYLIVTSAALKTAFGPLVAERQAQGFAVVTMTIETIVEQYRGRDTQEKIRNCIKNQFDPRRGPSYVLLGGDDLVVPVRYGQAKPRAASKLQAWVPCDLYYSDTSNLDWDADHDGRFGEFSEDASDIGLMPSVCLGRLPVRTPEQVSAYVRKVILFDQQARSRRNHACLFLGGSTNLAQTYYRTVRPGCPNARAVFLGQSRPASLIDEFHPLATDRAVNLLNSGFDFVTYSGEGFNTGWAFMVQNQTFSVREAEGLTNLSCLSIVRSGGCKTGWFDGAEDPCLAEAFLRNPNGGAVVYAGFARNLSHDPVAGGGQYQGDYYRQLFRTPGITVGEAFMMTKQAMVERSRSSRWHQYSYTLFGDPAIIPVPRGAGT